MLNLPTYPTTESALIGAIFVTDGAFQKLRARGMSGEWFTDGRYQDIWNLAQRQLEAGKKINITSFVDAFPGNGALISQCESAYIGESCLDTYFEELKRCFQRKEAYRATLEMQSLLENGHNNEEETLDKLDALNRRIGNALLKENRCYTKYLRDVSAYKQTPPSRKSEIIEGFARAGHVLSVSGGSKSHKSFALLDLAIQSACLQRGNWMGLRTMQHTVIYANLELEESDVWDRVEAMKKKHGIENIPPGRFHLLQLRNEDINKDQFLKLIREAAAATGATIIIIDPIYVLYDENTKENDAVSMLMVLKQMGRIARDCNALVCYVHHYAKGDQSQKFAQDRGSGAGTLRRFPDALIAITELENNANTEEHYRVDFEVRSYAPIKPAGMVWEYPCFVPHDGVKLHKIKSPTKQPAHKDSEYLDELDDCGMTFTQWKTACVDKFEISEATFERSVKRMVDLGSVQKVEQGKGRLKTTKYFRTAARPTPEDDAALLAEARNGSHK